MRAGDVIVDRFEIERRAGSGGMGTVYRALDRHSGEAIALKVVPEPSPTAAERFVREARVLAELRHPGVVRYVAHGRAEGGLLFLAMEWLDGEDLGARLEHSGLSVAEALALGRRIAETLGSAHARGIVHRDIKPGNIFLPGGEVPLAKLLDFGVVRLVDRSTAATHTGVLVGTPGYMAPEQARGERDVGPRADVFSLGCVLYRCLTGQPAFVADDLVGLLAKLVFEDPPRVAEMLTSAPPALDDLVWRMMSKDASTRPVDGRAVAWELGTIAPTQARMGAPLSVATSRVLTSGEQRLVSVVLAPDRTVDDDDTATPDQIAALLARVRKVLAPVGARLERLANGTLVAIVSGEGSAIDQASRAARSALAMRAELPGLPIVLATGRAVLRSELPVGEVVARATRVLDDVGSSAGPLDTEEPCIWLDDVTASLVEGRFDVGAEGPHPVLRGELEANETSRLLLGRPSPFVGRERELATLVAMAEEAAGEPVARAALVVGGAGVGKTRLAAELVARIRQRGLPFEIWRAQGDSTSSGAPFGLLGQALRRALGIRGGEPIATRRDKVALRAERHGAPASARVARFLGELVGTPFDEDGDVELASARHDAMLMGDQMRWAWLELLGAECSVHPMLLVVDDLQWADLPSLQFIDAALRDLGERPLMVVGLARPEVRERFPKLWAERSAAEMPLGDLGKRASETLVRAALGEATRPETVSELVDRAGGNAFYLEELVRTVADGRQGALPETVLAMVQARLDALEPDARRVLRAGSVFGQVFWRGGAIALLGGESEGDPKAAAARGTRIVDRIKLLLQSEVLVRRGESRFVGEREYQFRQAMVRDAVYATLTEEDRRLGHRLAARWLERLGESRAAVLASHFELGAQPRDAAAAYRRAAEQALEGGDFDGVVAFGERGLLCDTEARATAESDERSAEVRAALRVLLAEALRWRGEYAEAERRATDAIAAAPRGSATWYHAIGEAAVAHVKTATHRGLTDLVEQLRERRASGGDPASHRLVATVRVSNALFLMGDYDLAGELLGWVERGATVLESVSPMLAAYIHQSRSFRSVLTGDPLEGATEAALAAEAFERAGNRRTACGQRVNAGSALVQLGAFEEAEATLREGLATALALNLVQAATSAKQVLALALARLGRIAEARAMASEALAIASAQGDPRTIGYCRAYLATVIALAGELEAAELEARAAAAALAALPPSRAYALGTLALILVARGAPEDALEVATQALALLESLGGLEEGEALVRLAYVEALLASGEIEGARGALRAAHEALLARVGRIRDISARERLLMRVPENARTIELVRRLLVPSHPPPTSGAGR